jgi:hypothetical protein
VFAHMFERFSRLPKPLQPRDRYGRDEHTVTSPKVELLTLPPSLITRTRRKARSKARSNIKTKSLFPLALKMSIFRPKEPPPATLPSATQTRTKYWIPSAANNPTFDSFFYHKGTGEDTGIGLQVTLGARDMINPTGLETLYYRLNAGQRTKRRHWFVFVICKGYKLPCPEPSAEQLKKFRFFTMELKLPDGELLSLPLVHASVVDDVFVGADPKIFEGAVGEEPDGQLVLP